MILIQGKPPPFNTVKFFDRLIPSIWQQVAAAVQAGLTEVDSGGVDATIITSWFRSPLDNRRVGGHPDSQHLVGLAFDIQPGKGNSSIAINEAAQIFQRLGFTVVPSQTHVHIQTFPPGILRRVGVLDALQV